MRLATTLAEEQPIFEELANLPTGPDAQGYQGTQRANEMLESSRLNRERDLAANTHPRPKARELAVSQHMASLRETVIADRPDLQPDGEELAQRYHRFPGHGLTSDQ